LPRRRTEKCFTLFLASLEVARNLCRAFRQIKCVGED
jgi:hypothetical protein